MRFSNLKKASDYEVNDWLSEELELTPYQKERLINRELVRFAPFEFYKQKTKEKVSFFWRLTILIIPMYIILLYIGSIINYMINGKWGLSRTFLDKFHYPWMNKLKINL